MGASVNALIKAKDPPKRRLLKIVESTKKFWIAASTSETEQEHALYSALHSGSIVSLTGLKGLQEAGRTRTSIRENSFQNFFPYDQAT